MNPTIAPKTRRRAYIIRADVEFLHDGHAAQQQEAAADVQQQASYFKKKKHFIIVYHILKHEKGKTR